jgi:outer membrane protein assembly factor BamA
MPSLRRSKRVVLFLILAGRLQAQQTQNPDSVLATEKNVMLTPFLAPGYTPEMGLLLSLGALVSFRTSPALKAGAISELVQRSTITFNGSYSTSQALNLNGDLSSFWMGDRLRIYVKFAYKDMPDNYWGVGYEAGQAPEVDSLTGYQRDSWLLQPKVVYRISSRIFVGGMLDLNSTTASDVGITMENDPYFQEFGEVNQNTGAGLVFQFDTRDVAANAWTGMYLNVQSVWYAEWLSGDNAYQVYDIDYRQYKQLSRPGITLAWTGRTRLSYGDVPWAELSMVGSSTDLRGYRQGRYRNKAMLYGIVEYRHQFLNEKRKGGMSRHGYVGWVGVGSVGENFKGLNDWLPNLGVGYRFEVQPRMSVRADLGFGKEFLSSGDKFVPSVYFSFTEAF